MKYKVTVLFLLAVASCWLGLVGISLVPAWTNYVLCLIFAALCVYAVCVKWRKPTN